MAVKLIKRYPNRRLYDTQRGEHITLDTLADDLMRGEEVKVIENKTGKDITRRVMLQAMLTDEHAHKLDCLPKDFLRTILQLEDSTMRALFNHYVRVTLSSFAVAQNGMQQNIELFKSMAPNPTQVLQGITNLIRKPPKES